MYQGKERDWIDPKSIETGNKDTETRKNTGDPSFNNTLATSTRAVEYS
jgi:hypothetical protein